MWRELIQSLDPTATLLPAATSSQIANVKSALGITLPESLKNLLYESNGVLGKYGISLLWSTEEIIQRNWEMRTPAIRAHYLPFEHFLFFTGAGNGDQFAFGIIEGEIKFERVFAWNHEDDSRVCVAWSLKDFLVRWFSGKLLV